MSDALARIEALVREVEGLPGPSREKARALVGAVLEAHQGALARLVAELGPRAGQVAEDEALGAVLLLHGLHPQDVTTRVRRALDRARPALRRHGGDVELLAVTAEAVELRLTGTCDGCPSSASTLRGLIEEAVLALAPDAPPLRVVGAAPARPEPAPLVCR